MVFEKVKVFWSEALHTWELRNLGFLVLVSIRALKDMYKALIYAWFLPTALLAGLVLEVKSLVMAFYTVLLMRAARPSLDLKKVSYWRPFNPVDWIIFFILLLLVEGIPFVIKEKAGAAVLTLYTFFLKILFLGNFMWLPGSKCLGVAAYFLSPFIILCALFMLDSQKTVWEYIKACGRAILMLLYNYPFFLGSYLILRAIVSISYLISQPFIEMYPSLPLIGWILLFTLLIPFYICFIMSFYVKHLHAQFALYYKP